MSNSNPFDQFSSSLLSECGLNMQATLPVEQLPADLYKNIQSKVRSFKQDASLLLIGNGGPRFWNYLSTQSLQFDDPIDHLSIALVRKFVEQEWPGVRYCFLYPGNAVLDLQVLGRLAGWHHDSPLKLGINPIWGLWFAYRALVLIDAKLPVTEQVKSNSPCLSCESKLCVQSCPAHALERGQDALSTCSQYRLKQDSLCKTTCLARLSCPVQVHCRYDKAQIKYHYSVSLKYLQ